MGGSFTHWRPVEWARGRAPDDALQLVLLTLATYASAAGATTVGQNTLAENCALNKRTIQRRLDKLEDQKLIRRFRQIDSRGHRDVDLIVLAPVGDRGQMTDLPDEISALVLDDTTVSRRNGASLGDTVMSPRTESQGDSQGDSLGDSLGDSETLESPVPAGNATGKKLKEVEEVEENDYTADAYGSVGDGGNDDGGGGDSSEEERRRQESQALARAGSASWNSRKL